MLEHNPHSIVKILRSNWSLQLDSCNEYMLQILKKKNL